MGIGDGFTYGAFKDAVKNHIQDKERREQIIDTIKEVDNEIKDYDEHVKKTADNIKVLVKDPEATREDFDAFFDRETWRRNKTLKTIADARFQVRDLMSEDEWNTVYQQTVEKAREEKEKAK
jgi:hypothetical protein